MKQIKKTILILLSLLPVKSIAYAIEYNASVAFPVIDEEKLKEEFFYKLDNQQLPEKYYSFLEKHGIYTSDELREDRNATILTKVLRQFKRERANSGHLCSNASSILPD